MPITLARRRRIHRRISALEGGLQMFKWKTEGRMTPARLEEAKAHAERLMEILEEARSELRAAIWLTTNGSR